ncbi:NB-ARC domain, LRR domain containing protein [Parasponia andersonii]|uniref:NB-ARC domain, LRR domain containing protein n=1 Tax=Parasponia andersonii TaxID=3476 RepID=A0A2P5DBD7_PARAD|nr:NB-ARC domain, LRR domain containing protein [Parasponia andersonii]
MKQKARNVGFFSRACIGKEVIQVIEEMQKLYREGRKLPVDLVISLPKKNGEILLTTTFGEETTPEKKIVEIWACLMDGEERKIGVYGMGGIGKTTVMKHINNQLLRKGKDKFDDVIWVTVSKASSVFQLQYAVACEINLDLSRSDDETKRASKLYAELIKKGRYVLILDDLWDIYRFEEVGIPEPSAQNGCKLILTTRLLSVCLGMSCKAIQMERLSDKEALDLFMDTVGGDILSIPNLEETVKLVVKECANLPLAIVTIAGSLKGIDDSNVWKTALEDLGASAKGTNEIFEKLKFSYDRLNDKNLQNCLLCCALYPEDYEIELDLLIEYLIAEEIIKGGNRQAELERGKAMLKKLVNACLLEHTTTRYGQECVKMHDLIRDMAIQITSDSPRFLVEAGVGLKFIPEEDNWKEDLEKVSLMRNDILDIPSSFGSPNCPRLSTLLLCANHHLSSVSNNFFLLMKGLNLLDLSKTSIENLPESISGLASLTTLLLRKCKKLKYVPSLAKLTALKKLDFYESGIKEVPQGMEKLVKLRYLDLDKCKLEMIPDGILCQLSSLRSLSLNQECGTKIRGEELIHLRKLEILSGVLYDHNSFNAYVRSLKAGGPTYYILQLGFTDGIMWSAVRKWAKVVYLVNFNIPESVVAAGDCPLLLPKDVEILAIKRCRMNLSSLSKLTSFINATNLKWCYIKYCGEIEYLFSYSSTISHLLQTLEVLDLEAVWDLRGLTRAEKLGLPTVPRPPDIFSSLRKVRIGLCNNIRRLFRNASPLPNLEDLIIFECDQLIEIISTTSDYHEGGGGIPNNDIVVIDVALPKLSNLHLIALPKLKSIPVIADSLQQIIVRECPNLERIPPLDRESYPPSLQCVYIGQDLWESLEWDHPNTKAAIQAMRVQ